MSEKARDLRQAIFGDVSFVPIHLKDSGIAQSMADIVEFEVESRIDAAVAPLIAAITEHMPEHRHMTTQPCAACELEEALEPWRQK